MATYVEQIIKDSIEGGWRKIKEETNNGGWRLAAGYIKWTAYDTGGWYNKEKIDVSEALLDPAFWQAVGRRREWETSLLVRCQKCNSGIWGDVLWKEKMHQFIDYLADGDDYETALSKLV